MAGRTFGRRARFRLGSRLGEGGVDYARENLSSFPYMTAALVR